jgi:hypothetical protein
VDGELLAFARDARLGFLDKLRIPHFFRYEMQTNEYTDIEEMIFLIRAQRVMLDRYVRKDPTITPPGIPL